MQPGLMNQMNTGMIASNMSMMQRLQAERRQEREEHARRQRENWPGFDQGKTNSYIESLWDTPGQQNNPATSVNDTSALWGTIGNVWPSTMFGSTGMSYQGIGEEEPPQRPIAPVKEGEEGGLGFDPLALSSIWSAPNNQQKKVVDDTWSSTLFNNKEM
jgi:hypothetical protein